LGALELITNGGRLVAGLQLDDMRSLMLKRKGALVLILKYYMLIFALKSSRMVPAGAVKGYIKGVRNWQS
jgi:hypothetical protein